MALTNLELEILEKTGYNTSYMCKDLFEEEVLGEMISFVKEEWENLEHKTYIRF